MTQLSEISCDFCGTKADSGQGFMSGANAVVCERCIRGLYWRLQEERWPGKLWRLLGFNRADTEIEARIMLALVPAVALAWVVVSGPVSALLTRGLGGFRIVFLAAICSLSIVLMIAFLGLVGRALARGILSEIIIWCLWLVSGWLIWTPVGIRAAIGGMTGAAVLLYFVLRYVKAMQPSESLGDVR